MSSSLPDDADPVSVLSSFAADETVERFKAILVQEAMYLFAHIDHAGEAEKVGLQLRPTQVLIFGKARGGTPLMQRRQEIGLDLPLRVLVWEDAQGQVWLTYHRPQTLARQYDLADQDQAAAGLDAVLGALVLRASKASA